jgi:hypothetical protein
MTFSKCLVAPETSKDCEDYHLLDFWSSMFSIYNYLCNQCISPLKLRVRIPLSSGEVYSIQRYVIKFVSELRQVGGFLWVLRFHPPIKLTAMI